MYALPCMHWHIALYAMPVLQCLYALPVYVGWELGVGVGTKSYHLPRAAVKVAANVQDAALAPDVDEAAGLL